MRTFLTWLQCFAVLFILFLSACAHGPVAGSATKTLFLPDQRNGPLSCHFAPSFITDGPVNPHDRIGRPSVKTDARGNIDIYVDIEVPTVYFLKRKFETKKGSYTNLVYRIHFSETPFSIFPFRLTAGKNVGLIVVVTLDDKQKPILVTTVHTCGCYLAMVPTTYLPKDSLPENWKGGPLKVYGEILPNMLDYKKYESPKLIVHLKSADHRVMDLGLIEESETGRIPAVIEGMEILPLEALESLSHEGGVTSFYYHKGLKKGHVKGAIKPWETILMSWMSLDFFVGMDKAYSDTRVTENPFYTSLKPWNRTASDMWNFERFLEFWGWRL